MKPKKHKSQKIGLNPEFFKRYLEYPILCIIGIAIIVIAIIYGYKDYKVKQIELANQQAIEAAAIRYKALQEKINKEKSIEYIRQQQIAFKEEQQKKQNALNEKNKILNGQTADYWRKGSYVHNIKDNSYAVITSVEYPFVHTNEFDFIVDENIENKDIEFASLLEWQNYYNKKIAKAKKEKQKEMEKFLQQEKDKYTKIAKEKFPPSPKYGYCYYKDIGYRIVKWNGLDVVIEPIISDTRYPERKVISIYDKDIRKADRNIFFVKKGK